MGYCWVTSQGREALRRLCSSPSGDDLVRTRFAKDLGGAAFDGLTYGNQLISVVSGESLGFDNVKAVLVPAITERTARRLPLLALR